MRHIKFWVDVGRLEKAAKNAVLGSPQGEQFFKAIALLEVPHNTGNCWKFIDKYQIEDRP
jgi:hypothetical protein